MKNFAKSACIHEEKCAIFHALDSHKTCENGKLASDRSSMLHRKCCIETIQNYRSEDALCMRSGPEVIRQISCSIQLRIKFIMLINVKMPTIVGILKCMSMMNTTCARLKSSAVIILQHLNFHEQLKFHAQLS